jgi:hypothetical protein
LRLSRPLALLALLLRLRLSRPLALLDLLLPLRLSHPLALLALMLPLRLSRPQAPLALLLPLRLSLQRDPLGLLALLLPLRLSRPLTLPAPALKSLPVALGVLGDRRYSKTPLLQRGCSHPLCLQCVSGRGSFECMHILCCTHAVVLIRILIAAHCFGFEPYMAMQ